MKSKAEMMLQSHITLFSHVLPKRNGSTPWPPLEPILNGHRKPKLDTFKWQDVEFIYVHFYLSDLDKLYIKTLDKVIPNLALVLSYN